MKKEQMHRNKCQGCFKNIGRFILDCYCILCEGCFAVRSKNSPQCECCGKQGKGNFIDVKNEDSVNRMSYLFGNLETNMLKCLEIYRFQLNIDMRYCKFLENQIDRYKEAIREIVELNPPLAGYFDSKLANRTKNPHRSVSQRLPTPIPHNQQRHHDKPSGSSHALNTSRSISNSSIQMHHQRLIDAQRINGDRNYSGKVVGYKIPNINYNTAMRSSKRPSRRDEDDGPYYRERR